MLPRLRVSWKAVWGRSRMEAGMDEELRFHMAAYAEDLVRSGVPRAEAERRARLEFGGVESTKEDCRQALGLRLIDELQQDIRYAARSLRRNPGFTAVALITLALGIGVTTAIFSFVDATMLKPLPFREPEQLVQIRQRGVRNVTMWVDCSSQDLARWRTETRAFSDLAMVPFPSQVNLTGSTLEYPLPLLASAVSTNYFDFLGIHPVLGRGFLSEESQAGRASVAVLTNRPWKISLGADPNILGKPVFVNGKKYKVIGVLPPGLFDRRQVDLYLPLTAVGFGQLLGRLRPGVTYPQATIDVTRLLAQQPEAQEYKLAGWILPFQEAILLGKTSKSVLLLLLSAGGFVLLIACGNVANLLLARSAARQGEIAVRLSIGAGRLRLVRQLLTESSVLFLGGGALGALLAFWLVRILKASAPANFVPAEVDVTVDLRVLLFAFAVSLATSILFGLAPALRSTAPRLAAKWREKRLHVYARALSGGHRIQHAMLIAQIALAFVLVTGAALVTNSLIRLMTIDTGFDANRLLTGRLSLDPKLYPRALQKQAYFDHLTTSLRALPGVRSVAVANAAPFSEGHFDASLYLDGSQTKRGAMMWMVTPEYFDTIGMRLMRGRWLSAFDGQAAQPAAVVDADFARRYFGDQDPLGHTITSPILGDIRWTIVGVVGPVKFTSLIPEPWVGMYVPLVQLPAQPWERMVRAISFVLRVDGDPTALAPAIRSVAASLDRNQPVRDLATMSQLIDKKSVQDPRFLAMILTAFGAMALLLASVGIYGVFHYFVVQRTQEIGVRVALGAQVHHITGMILRQGIILAVPGVLLGLAGALALTRFLRSVLFEVRPRDPATLVVVALVILAACCLACYLPARRAAKIDPTEALRYE